jgi:calcineurin-like phosphoesterase family protein
MRTPIILQALILILLFPLTGCVDESIVLNVEIPQDLKLKYPAPARLVAIGDVHGDLQAARDALGMAGAIDANDNWIGGELVVVQVGDQLDRGNDEQAILDLFDRLQLQAIEAGGAFHVLNGNHELMNCSLDLRYVTPGGFTDFDDAVIVDTQDPELLEYPENQRSRVAAFRPGGPYAKRLANRNTIVIVGDTLFVHGGVHTEHIEYGLDRINIEIRSWLNGKSDRPEVIRGNESPVWCRHYSSNVVPESRELLESVLEQLNIKRMVVAHTVQEDGIRSYFDEQVWCVDVGMSKHYGNSPQVLEIVGEHVRIIK